MKEVPLATCERSFVPQAIIENHRLDGRKNDEFRQVKINFGNDWGSAIVSLGETKVLAQVSCELGLPKATRPNEGLMFINVELGPMAAPHFEAGRYSDITVQINRTLERTFKDSRCVDLESLCVTAEDRVWILRLDINVLNHEGNLIDCCSIASLCALAHFKRPDVSVTDDGVKIHSAAEKELIPMSLHHYPVCVTFCTFNDGKIALADPTVIEERTAESQIIFGLNSFRELCCLNLGGSTMTSSVLLLQCAKIAAQRAKLVVEHVKEVLQVDAAAREADGGVSFTECIRLNKISSLAEDRLALKLRNFSFQSCRDEELSNDDDEQMHSPLEGSEVISIDAQTSVLNPVNSNIKWIPDDNDDGSNDEMDMAGIDSENNIESGDNEADESLSQQVESALKYTKMHTDQPRSKQNRKPSLPFSEKNPTCISSNSDSEEDLRVIL